MSEVFTPEPEELPSVISLVKLTEVTEKDIAIAIQDWEDNPPDADYKTILNAEIRD